jgi:chaperone modulatory protein CbpM
MEVEVLELEWLEEEQECAAGQLAQQSRLPEDEILELVHCGAIPREPGRARSAARMAARLRQDFELDLQGVALALTLLRRIAELEVEVARYRAASP